MNEEKIGYFLKSFLKTLDWKIIKGGMETEYKDNKIKVEFLVRHEIADSPKRLFSHYHTYYIQHHFAEITDAGGVTLIAGEDYEFLENIYCEKKVENL